MFPGAGRYRTAGVQTARGCPHRCVYCTYPRLEGTRLRRRPPEAVADEMARLRRDLGTTEQFVVDSSFNADEGHMTAVCEELLARRSGPGATLADVSFSCYLQPRVSHPDVFRLLAAAGCTSVDFGIDTAAEAVLPGFGKSFTIDDLRESTAAAKAAGMDVCHSLLFGGPGETPETVAETVRVTDEVAPTAVVAMVGLRIYPETALARLARDEGLIGERQPLLEPRFYAAGRIAGDPEMMWLPRAGAGGGGAAPELVPPRRSRLERRLGAAGPAALRQGRAALAQLPAAPLVQVRVTAAAPIRARAPPSSSCAPCARAGASPGVCSGPVRVRVPVRRGRVPVRVLVDEVHREQQVALREHLFGRAVGHDARAPPRARRCGRPPRPPPRGRAWP